MCCFAVCVLYIVKEARNSSNSCNFDRRWKEREEREEGQTQWAGRPIWDAVTEGRDIQDLIAWMILRSR